VVERIVIAGLVVLLVFGRNDACDCTFVAADLIIVAANVRCARQKILTQAWSFHRPRAMNMAVTRLECRSQSHRAGEVTRLEH
jgi:hypothetical protein